MKKEREVFAFLSEQELTRVSKYMTIPELAAFSSTSKRYYTLFKPMIDTHELLHYVTRGKYKEVIAFLEDQNSKFIFKRNQVKDCSGRVFDNISAFEYALWSMDACMWSIMIACILDKNALNAERKQNILKKMLEQYNHVNTDGVTYWLNKKKITEKHFDFENTIIKELQTQMESTNAVGHKDWDAIDKQWREGVGAAQKLLPMHVVYEYCSMEMFNPIPAFILPKFLLIKPSQEFFNNTIEQHENWFTHHSKLGIDFAIFKGNYRKSLYAIVTCARGEKTAVNYNSEKTLIKHDLDAIKKLYETRTNNFRDLPSQLEMKIAEEEKATVKEDVRLTSFS